MNSKEYNRQYYLAHRSEIIKKRMSRYEAERKNIDISAERKEGEVTCICGSILGRKSIYKHYESKIHIRKVGDKRGYSVN